MREARIPQRYRRCELATFEHDMDSQREAYRRATAFVDAFPVVDRDCCSTGRMASARPTWRSASSRRPSGTRARAAISSRRASCCGWCATPTIARSKRPRWTCCAPVLKADLLVLDDLGAERTSEWVQETLGLVVNTRYNARRPTIFTSNLVDLADSTDPRSFIFQLGARTRSRLREMCDWVEMHGVDVREVGPARLARLNPALAEGVARLAREPAEARAGSRRRARAWPARGCGKLPPSSPGRWQAGPRASRRAPALGTSCDDRPSGRQ